MIGRILSVGGLTLLSRATGFARDVMLAAILGVGFLADAFVVAMRIPNHFRAIFGEGAFNAAFVPAYARIRRIEDEAQAHRFASRIFTLLLVVQVVLVVFAIATMPSIIKLLAPGFAADPAKAALAATLTRITFPYLLFVTLVTLVTGVLNATGRFAAGAFAPVLLNLAMIGALAVAFLFPSAAHAAAWGVTLAGILELALVMLAARRARVMPGLARYRHGQQEKSFFKAFWPAVIGSSGVQLAMFADTIIATTLAEGAASSVYYADRIYQLPVGVIAIAAGTVLLPEMSRLIAGSEVRAAHAAQSRAMAFTLALSAPFVIVFFLLADLVMSALFMRGAFSAADAQAAGRVLAAYGVGLPAIVLIRSVVAGFQARGDTRTPVIASFIAIGVNIALKLVLSGSLGAAGLALATSIGAWVNFGLLCWFAVKKGEIELSLDFARLLIAVEVAALAYWAFVAGLRAPLTVWSATLPGLRDEALLIALGGGGLALYATVLLVLGRLSGVRLRRI